MSDPAAEAAREAGAELIDSGAGAATGAVEAGRADGAEREPARRTDADDSTLTPDEAASTVSTGGPAPDVDDDVR